MLRTVCQAVESIRLLPPCGDSSQVHGERRAPMNLRVRFRNAGEGIGCMCKSGGSQLDA